MADETGEGGVPVPGPDRGSPTETGGPFTPAQLAQHAAMRIPLPDLIARYAPFHEAVADGHSIRAAHKLAGTTYYTWCHHREANPELDRLFRLAQRQASDLDEDEVVDVIRRAAGQTREEIARAKDESEALRWRAGIRNRDRHKGTNAAADGTTVVQVMIVNGVEVKF